MAAFNVVRFKVKSGREQDFVEAHRRMRPTFQGFKDGTLIRTGDRTFCLVGEWRSFKSIEAARPQMIEMLDQVREMLEELGGELGVTDPVSGEAVAKLVAKPARKSPAAKSSATRRAKKGAGTKASSVGRRSAKTAKKLR